MLSTDTSHYPSANTSHYPSANTSPYPSANTSPYPSADTSHYPSPDDIGLDSLEYLFGEVASSNARPIPWVEIDTAVKLTDKRSADLEKKKIRVLEQQLQDSNNQLHSIFAFVGYLQGLIHEKDEQITQIPSLRFKAGMAVARGIEAERAKERIRELEEALTHHIESRMQKPREMFTTLISSNVTDELAISILEWLGLIGLSSTLLALIFGI